MASTGPCAETGWLSAKGDQMKLRVAGDSPADPGVVPTTFRTDHLDVFPKENRARTDALVTMTRPGMEQSGVGFEVDSKNNTYHFLSQSKGPLHAQTLIPPPARDVSGQAQGRQPPSAPARPGGPTGRTDPDEDFLCRRTRARSSVPSAAFAKSTDRNEDMHIDSGAQSGTLTGDGKTVLSQGVIITRARWTCARPRPRSTSGWRSRARGVHWQAGQDEAAAR